MNLHVTNDKYGLYPVEIAKRIKNSANSHNNLIVNLFSTSHYTDSIITYIPETDAAFKKYIASISHLDKIIFHPFTLISYRFLKIAIKKFPNLKTYWMCWSSELYRHQLTSNLTEPFSLRYLKKINFSFKYFRDIFKNFVQSTLAVTKIIKSKKAVFYESVSSIDFFCSPFYSDFLFLKELLPDAQTQYLPVAYLSLNNVLADIPVLNNPGHKIMIGHSASPDLNHYEIITRISKMNADYFIFLPLSYGDEQYGKLIKSEAQKAFNNIEVLEKKLEREAYYKKLTEVGWVIINAKVQQAVGNIIALIWMGCKVFLDKNASTYKDFLAWGIHVYNTNEDLNDYELTHLLKPEQIATNRKKIMEKFNEDVVSKGWKEFLY